MNLTAPRTWITAKVRCRSAYTSGERTLSAMDSVTLLRAELKGAHDLLEAVMVDVTTETADWMPPGRANPVGATDAHVVISEDRTIQGMLRHRHPLYETTFEGK